MKKYTTLFTLACMTILGFATCKKTNNNPDNNAITLATPVQNGSLLTLNWTKLNNSGLLNYVVMRVVDTANEANPTQIEVGKDTTQFTDSLALMPYVQYWIVGVTKNNTYVSNKVTYFRNDINFMNIYPMDALIDHTTQLLYITGSSYGANSGVVAIYNLQQQKPVTTVTLGAANIGYCDLGTYNGTRELYVPGEDGNLYIYNAASLALIGHISVGSSLNDVVCSGNILYIAGQTSSVNYTYVYNRATQLLINQSSTVSNIRLRLIPGTNSSLYAVSEGNNDYLYNYDNNGNLLYQKIGYPGYVMNPSLFEVSPNGTSFISGNGQVFNDSLAGVATMPHDSLYYTSVCFDSTGQWIYGATSANTIIKYSASGYNVTNTYRTQGTPAKIFYYNGGIVSVSYYEYHNTFPNITENFTFVEHF